MSGERVSSCLSFIRHLKIHRRHEPLSRLSSVHVSVRRWSLVGCRLSAWHIVQKHHLPSSSSSMALTLAYGWHGTSWMCAAFCCPENRLILAQSCSPFTTLLPPMPWSQLASFHQTSDRPPAPRVPPHELEYWSGLCQLGLCVLLLLHCTRLEMHYTSLNDDHLTE